MQTDDVGLCDTLSKTRNDKVGDFMVAIIARTEKVCVLVSTPAIKTGCSIYL